MTQTTRATAMRSRTMQGRRMRAAGFGPQQQRRRMFNTDAAGGLDWMLIGAVVGIALLGMVMIYSTTRNLIDDDPLYFVKRQSIALVIAAGLVFAIMKIDYRKFRDFSMLAYVITVVLLFFVLTPIGAEAKGAQAWYQLPFNFQLQPSEIAKFGIIVALAGYVNEHRGDIDAWRLTVIIGLALVPIGLVQLQPDLGTNMVLICVVLALLAVAGVRGRYLLVLGLLGITLIYAVISVGVLKQYQLDRLTVPYEGATGERLQGAAYNQDQSVKTISSGGVLGQGITEGKQTELGFVPEQQTDFIFTAVGEELGFVGAVLLMSLFGIVLWRTWRTAQLARDYYGTLVCAGVLGMFTFMIFENIGMTLGIMPVTGIPLPFMSYGGSSLLACAACIALVLNVHANRFN
jgi:rod shape determining protein RodA